MHLALAARTDRQVKCSIIKKVGKEVQSVDELNTPVDPHMQAVVKYFWIISTTTSLVFSWEPVLPYLASVHQSQLFDCSMSALEFLHHAQCVHRQWHGNSCLHNNIGSSELWIRATTRTYYTDRQPRKLNQLASVGFAQAHPNYFLNPNPITTHWCAALTDVHKHEYMLCMCYIHHTAASQTQLVCT